MPNGQRPERFGGRGRGIASLVGTGVNWIDDKAQSRPLVLNDVLIVAPYNAHVSDLSKRIPNARVGTVNKFQGQQLHLTRSPRSVLIRKISGV